MHINREKPLKDNNFKMAEEGGPKPYVNYFDWGGKFESLCYLTNQWAEERNITADGGATSYTQIPKLIEEVNEFRDAKTEEEAKLEFGDILVVCIQIARLRGLDMVECLDLAYGKIKTRTGRLENGVFIKDAS